jgi:hypothetical protein
VQASGNGARGLFSREKECSEMAQTNVTVATGKKLTVSNGAGGSQTKVATETIDLDAHEAKRVIAAGIATATE